MTSWLLFPLGDHHSLFGQKSTNYIHTFHYLIQISFCSTGFSFGKNIVSTRTPGIKHLSLHKTQFLFNDKLLNWIYNINQNNVRLLHSWWNELFQRFSYISSIGFEKSEPSLEVTEISHLKTEDLDINLLSFQCLHGSTFLLKGEPQQLILHFSCMHKEKRVWRTVIASKWKLSFAEWWKHNLCSF